MSAVAFDLLLTNLRLATLRDRGNDGAGDGDRNGPGAGSIDGGLHGSGYGAIEAAALGIRGDRIVFAGPARDLPRDVPVVKTVDGGGRWATPGLIDCHTHVVYAGHRAREFEQRLLGASYADLAAAGGGIRATVLATRAASDAALAAASGARIAAMAAQGTTTVEIKSGYGLDTATELRQLAVARQLATERDVDVRTTLLAAHALPPGFAGHADDYIDYVCEDTIPAAAAAGLADAVDAFCETIGFTAAQTRRVFEAAGRHQLPVKLHADQLSDCGGAALAAQFHALSADHLEFASAEGIDAMARSGTVAVLLPGAYLALGETQLPPVDALRARRVPIAIATDCNPGTSPATSLPLMMNLACTLFRLTPQEALAGATRHAARALGLADRGTLAPGQRADIALWDIDHPAELAYRIGAEACAGVIRGGRVLRGPF